MYADIVTNGDVVETIPGDISTMDDSSQNKGTSAHETSFEGFSIPNRHSKEFYHSLSECRRLPSRFQCLAGPGDAAKLENYCFSKKHFSSVVKKGQRQFLAK